MGKRHFVQYISLFFAMTFWGASFVLTKHLLIDFNPIFIIFSRLLISSIIFVVTSLILYKKRFFIEKKYIILFISLSIFEPLIYFLFETYSLQLIDPSIVSVIIATIPLFMAIFAYYFLLNYQDTFVELYGDLNSDMFTEVDSKDKAKELVKRIEKTI